MLSVLSPSYSSHPAFLWGEGGHGQPSPSAHPSLLLDLLAEASKLVGYDDVLHKGTSTISQLYASMCLGLPEMLGADVSLSQPLLD